MLTQRQRRSLPAVLAGLASVALHVGAWWWLRDTKPPERPPGTTPIQVTYAEAPPLPTDAVTEQRRPIKPPKRRPRPSPPEFVETPAEAAKSDDAVDDPAAAEPEGSAVASPEPDDAPAAPGFGVGGPARPGPPMRRPEQVSLFDTNALGRVATAFSPRFPEADVRLGGGGNGDDPASEHARVSNRIGTAIGQAIAAGNAQAGLVSDCFDGVDQGFDDAIDCAAPGCREHPLCLGTRVYDIEADRTIPDDDMLGAPSHVDVEDTGPVRAVSVKVAFTHPSPGDLAIVLEAPDGRRAVLRRADRADPLFGRAFFARELVGTGSGGRWRLRVMDVISGVTGRFDRWELVLTTG